MYQMTDRIGLVRYQGGSSLVVSMIMLVVLMLMGVGAIVVSNTQFRMAGNLQFQNLAMANAESAMSVAENWIAGNIDDPDFQTRVAGGVYPETSAIPDPYSMAWNDTTSEKADLFGNQRYTVQVLGTGRAQSKASWKPCEEYTNPAECQIVNVYRVTSRGVSVRGSIKIVQSVFVIPAKVF